MFKFPAVFVLLCIAIADAAPRGSLRSLAGIDGWIMIPEKIINTEILGDAPATSASQCTAAIAKAGQNAGAWDAAANKCLIVKTRTTPSTIYMDTTFKNGNSVDFSLSGFTSNSTDTKSKCDLVVKEGQAESKVFCVKFPGNANAVVLVRSGPPPPFALSGIDGWILLPQRMILGREIINDVPATSAFECSAAITKAGQNAGAWDSSANKCTIVKTRKRSSTIYMDTTFNNGVQVNFSLSRFTDDNADPDSKCDLVVKEGQEESKVFCVRFPGNNLGIVLVRSTPVPVVSLSGIDGWIMLPQRMIVGKQIFGDAPAKSASECTAAIIKAGRNAGFWDSSVNKCTIAETRNRPSTMFLDGTFNNGYSVNFSLSWFTQDPVSDTKDLKCDIVIKEAEENAKYFCVDFWSNNNAVVLVRQK